MQPRRFRRLERQKELGAHLRNGLLTYIIFVIFLLTVRCKDKAMLLQEVEQLVSRYVASIQRLDATYERLVATCDALDATIDEINRRLRGDGEA
jgi:hypothetical protein